MKTKKILFVLGLCMGVLFLAGCSTARANNTQFQMGFSALFIDSTAVVDYGAMLASEMPELTIDGTAPRFTPIIAGVIENDWESGILHDPMMGIGGIMKTTLLVAGGDLDVMVATLDNAARDARNGMFLPLDQVFTAEEMAAFGERLLQFEHVETDGIYTWATGEMTAIYGINITGNEDMQKIFGGQEIGVFIIANTSHLDLAREVMLHLAE